MLEKRLKEIIEKTEKLSESATGLGAFLSGNELKTGPLFDVSIRIPGTETSVVDCIARIHAINASTAQFQDLRNALMVPTKRVDNFSNLVDKASKCVENLEQSYRNHLANGQGQKSFNYENFHIQTDNGQNLNIAAPFTAFPNSVEALLDSFYDLSIAIKPTKSAFRFQAAANALSARIQETEKRAHDLEEKNLEIQKLIQITEDRSESTKKIVAEIERLQERAAKDRTTISEQLADVQAKVATITETHSSASELRAQIDSYQEKFKEFDRQIKIRNERFEQGKLEQETLFQEFELKRKKNWTDN
jgi:hypothetical protein